MLHRRLIALTSLLLRLYQVYKVNRDIPQMVICLTGATTLSYLPFIPFSKPKQRVLQRTALTEREVKAITEVRYFGGIRMIRRLHTTSHSGNHRIFIICMTYIVPYLADGRILVAPVFFPFLQVSPNNGFAVLSVGRAKGGSCHRGVLRWWGLYDSALGPRPASGSGNC